MSAWELFLHYTLCMFSLHTFAVDWELTEAAQAAQISTDLHRLQQLRNRQVGTGNCRDSMLYTQVLFTYSSSRRVICMMYSE